MNYQTFEPHQELEVFVKCYWTLESSVDEQLENNSSFPMDGINLVEIFLLNSLSRLETIDHIVRSTVETILTGN